MFRIALKVKTRKKHLNKLSSRFLSLKEVEKMCKKSGKMQ